MTFIAEGNLAKDGTLKVKQTITSDRCRAAAALAAVRDP